MQPVKLGAFEIQRRVRRIFFDLLGDGEYLLMQPVVRRNRERQTENAEKEKRRKGEKEKRRRGEKEKRRSAFRR